MDHSNKTPREQFTSALQECVEENEWKYAGFTSDIYYALFGKGANELKNIMGANPHESAKEAMPPYMRLLAEKMEAEFAAALKNKFAEKGRALTMDEALDVLIALETNDFWGKIIFKKTYKPDHNDAPGHKAPEPIPPLLPTPANRLASESEPLFLDDNAEYIQETWLEDQPEEESEDQMGIEDPEETDESEPFVHAEDCIEVAQAYQSEEPDENVIEAYHAMEEEERNSMMEREEKLFAGIEDAYAPHDEPYNPSNFHDDSNFWMRAGDFWDQFMETFGPGGLLFILALIGVWILKIFW